MALGQKLVEMTGVPAKIPVLKMCADEFAKPLCDIHNQQGIYQEPGSMLRLYQCLKTVSRLF